MYYSNGNYEAFARPKKPEGVDQKSAYLIGSGLASLAAAAFLLRDGQMAGERIHILEELPLPGGSLDGAYRPHEGFVTRGGREMESHFECLWDLYRSIPSIETEGVSVLDEYYWLNKEDPNYSLCRLVKGQGKQLETDGQLTLTDQAIKEIVDLTMTPEEDLNNKRIDEVFTEDFFNSNFWMYWQTMFAFETWHSAMEMRRYLMRFVHHVGDLATMSGLKFTKYNQYESLVLPLVKYLEDNGVHFQYDTQVTNIIVDIQGDQKIAKSMQCVIRGQEETIELTPNDLVFVTNGSITESSTYGDHKTPAPVTKELGGSWTLWKNLAAQDKAFGKPEVFCENIPDAAWYVSATVTTLDEKIPAYIQKLCKRDPFAGKTVTGGIITATDSNWLTSFTVNRQPQFKEQPKDQIVVWVYALYSDRPGDYVKKPITECSGEEIAQEWLYHMGVPVEEIDQLAAESCRVVPCYMPYITSYFMPRAIGDRPAVVPEGSQNLAFIGNFAESPTRDTVFTTEYSVRTAMEAVYTLLNVDRGVPEVFASCFDVRTLMEASYYLNDKKPITDIKVPWFVRLAEKHTLKKIRGTYIEQLLKEYHLEP